MVDMVQTLVYGWPGTEWSVGEDYASLVWNDISPKPTEAEVNAKWTEISGKQDKRTRLIEEFELAYADAVANNTPTERSDIVGEKLKVEALLNVADEPAARAVVDNYVPPANLAVYKTSLLAIFDGPEYA